MTISGKTMNLNKLNRKLKVAGHNGFTFNEINKLTIIFFSYLRYINIRHYLKFRKPMYHRQFFKLVPQNPEYGQNHCNNLDNPFHFACRRCFDQLKKSFQFNVIIIYHVSDFMFTFCFLFI